MPKSKWAVANAALAAVKLKGKIKTNNKKKEKAIEKGKQSSSESSIVSSDSFDSSSGKGHSRSDDSDSYSDRSSDQSLDTASSGGGQPSDGSTSSDSSSSYGCGVYHRRESLSQSSSESCLSDDSSFSSGSSRSSGSYLTSQSTSSPEPKESHSERTPSDLDVESTPSKPLTKATSLKKPSRRDAEVDVDEESHASSKVSRNSNKSSNSTNRLNKDGSLTPSMYDDEQASMMQRRGGGRGRGRSMGRGGSSRELKTQGSLKKVVTAQNAKFANDDHPGEPRMEDADGKFDALLQRVRSQKSVVKEESSTGIAGPSSKEQKNKPKPAIDKNKSSRGSSTKAHKLKSQGPDTNVEAKTRKGSSSATGSRDAGGELSCSYKTTLLANANSNLRSSVTSVASEEPADSQNDDASKKVAGSSRFASMMANLKSSNDIESKQITRGSRDGGGSDDEHIFEAPKIVDEKGQSKDLKGEIKIEGEDEDESKRSRFRVRTPSIRQLIGGKSDKSLDSAQNSHKDASDEKQNVSPVERPGEYHSDDYSEHSDASISTASSGEDQYGNSVTNHARMKYPEDEDNSSDDYMEYYGEPAMTILTPITEMASLESDVETASHISDASDTDSDDGPSDSLQSNTVKTDDQSIERDRGSKAKSEKPSNMFQVIEHARRNAPNFKRIELDDSGLDDFDTAKLFYSLHENTHVTHVSLANNKLGDASALSLAKILLVNKTIAFVCLRGNNIGNQGATALEKVLRINDTLTHLDINDNDIDSYVIEGLQKTSAVIVPSDFYSLSFQVESESRGRTDESHTPSESSSSVDNLISDDSAPNNRRANHLSHMQGDSDPCPVPAASRPFLEIENNEALSLIKIYDKLSVSDDAHHPVNIQDGFFSMQESDTMMHGEKNPRLVAMSLALSSLDSEWVLNTTTGGPGRPPLTHNTLRGERTRAFMERLCQN